jgi:glycosyltransferase involved in cell wall biosynthesis
MYDYIIVTHLPTFYKVNLYNELAKKLNIFVVFIANDTNEKRALDFTASEKAVFEFTILSQCELQSRNKVISIYKLFLLINKKSYKKILLSGWDLPEFWFLLILYPNNKNCLALESTIIESNVNGLKGGIKRVFLSMIGTVFASGRLHVDLLNKLNYQKEISVTKGVGIINKPTFEKINKVYQKHFVFVGRLSKVKNLVLLIDIFNELPDHKLTIIGDGEEIEYLTSIANENIKLSGPMENTKLKNEFNKNDIFILPSISEPWGLVVEEALYFGLPVIVSKNCGSCELIEDGVNGYLVPHDDHAYIKEIIMKIDTSKYEELIIGVENFSISKKDAVQVDAYINILKKL